MNSKVQNDNLCTVLVTGCDAYRDMEDPFIRLFRRFWPDCPYELVLLTETDCGQSRERAPRFDRVIATGKGLTWSRMLVAALDRISTPTVLMLMNDYLLEGPVETALISERVEQAVFHHALNLRLEPSPPGDEPFADGLLRKHPNTAYAVSCKAGIWDRLFLRSLACETKSAWEFERYGSFMIHAGENRPLLVAERREFPFCDAVHKGCWEKSGVALLRRESIDYDFSRRSRPGLVRRAIEAIKGLVFAIFPLTLIVRIQNRLGVGWK